MSRTTRPSLALVLSLAFAAVPLVLDQCAASCDVARSADASASAPTCHHASSPAAQIGRPPNGCGHDHSGAVATLTVAAAPPARTSLSALAAIPSPTLVDIAIAYQIDVPFARPPSTIPSRALFQSLRI